VEKAILELKALEIESYFLLFFCLASAIKSF
jgi:hypothetical protein